MTENPWAKAKELNRIHRQLMACHPMKADRTPEEAVAWNENIALYEEALGKQLVRGNDGEVIVPFQTV